MSRILPHRSSSSESEILGRSRSTSSNRRDKLPVVVSSPGRKILRVLDRSRIQDCNVVEGEASDAGEDLVYTIEIDSDNDVVDNQELEKSVVFENVVEKAVPRVKKVASSGTLKLRKSSVKTLKEDNMNETANFEGKMKFENGKYKCKKCMFQCLEIEAIYARKHARMLKCPFTEKSNSVLRKKYKASTKIYNCEECDMTYVGKVSLNKHRRTDHVLKNHRCSICHKEFSVRKYYRQHIKDHRLKFICIHCPMKFPRRQHLEIHIRNFHFSSQESSSNASYSNRGWKNQVTSALNSGDTEKIENTFKVHIRTCSTSSKLWLSYLEWRKSKLTNRNEDEVNSLKKLVEEALEEDLDSRIKISMFAAKLAEECGDVQEATEILAKLRNKVKGNVNASELSTVIIETSKLEAKADNYKTAYGLLGDVVNMKFKSIVFETKKYKCSVCSHELSSKRNLDRHLVLVHKEKECDKCGEKFEGQKTLYTHSMSCPQVCQIIGCSFKSVQKWRVNKHMRQKHKIR